MLILSAVTMCLGAALLFVVQPMVGKRLLPLLGGSPGVWNGCLVFFQLTLLLGYVWSHRVARRGGPIPGARWHLVLVLLACACLPLGLPERALPGAEASPLLWVFTSLALMVGLPALCLAATAPLVQAWFAASDHARARDPYFLYAASNLGSAGALLAYPLLIEPRLSQAAQERAWSWAFGLFALLLAGLAIACRGAGRAASASAHAAGGGASGSDTRTDRPRTAGPALADAAVSAAARGRWALLAALPSALVLASTQHITTDIASIPLLWIAPLGLYLATYVLAFARVGALATTLARRLLPFAVTLAAVLMLFGQRGSVELQLGAHLAALACAAQLCHGRLAALRPPASALTSYYFWIALGGVLGGSAVSLLAPQLFDSLVEYPLLLVAACAVAAWEPAGARAAPVRASTPAATASASAGAKVGAKAGARAASTATHAAASARLSRQGLALAASAALAWCALWAGRELPAGWAPDAFLFGIHGDAWLAMAVPAGVLAVLSRWPAVFCAGLAAVLLLPGPGLDEGRVLHRQRTFFGVHEVVELESDAGRFHMLLNGTTIHGVQGQGALAAVPTSYYGSDGPVGDLLANAAADGPIDMAVLGLGAGALALHGRPGWTITYFEIDPAVVAIARDPRLFSCLSLSEAQVSVVVGDGRRRLAQSAAQYDLILLDAFSSDAVPVHLLTVEAIETYLEHLAPGGTLVFNVSNDYLALAQVLAAAAEQLGLVTLGREYSLLTEAQEARQECPSLWVALARSRDDLDPQHFAPGWGWLSPADDGARPWTDDFSSLLLARFRSP